jgi:hypothetical protein
VPTFMMRTPGRTVAPRDARGRFPFPPSNSSSWKDSGAGLPELLGPKVGLRGTVTEDTSFGIGSEAAPIERILGKPWNWPTPGIGTAHPRDRGIVGTLRSAREDDKAVAGAPSVNRRSCFLRPRSAVAVTQVSKPRNVRTRRLQLAVRAALSPRSGSALARRGANIKCYAAGKGVAEKGPL